MKKKQRKSFAPFFSPLLIAAMLFCFLYALSTLDEDRAVRDKQQLETALTRAAVACYAAEGVYPPDAAYLEEHYGIQINKKLYTVKYEVIASNLMPDITVLENQP